MQDARFGRALVNMDRIGYCMEIHHKERASSWHLAHGMKWIFLLFIVSPGLLANSLEHPRLYFLRSDIAGLAAKAENGSQIPYGISTKSLWQSIKAHADFLTDVEDHISASSGVVLVRRADNSKVRFSGQIQGQVQIGDTIIIPESGGMLTRLPGGSSRMLAFAVLRTVRCTTPSSNRRIVVSIGRDPMNIGPNTRIGCSTNARRDGKEYPFAVLQAGSILCLGSDPNTRAQEIGERVVFLAATRLVAVPSPFHFEEKAPSRGIPGRKGFVPSELWEYTLTTRAPSPHPQTSYFAPWTRMTDYLRIETEYLCVAYAVTRSSRYLTSLKQIAGGISRWSVWTDKDYNPRWESNLDTANLLSVLSWIYDVCYEDFSQGELASLRSAMAKKGILPIETNLAFNQVWNNPGKVGVAIGSYVNSLGVQLSAFGRAAVCLLGEDKRAPQWVSEAKGVMELTFGRIAAPNGGFYEGFGYGGAASDDLTLMADVFIRNSQLPSDFFNTQPFYVNLESFLFAATAPVSREQATFGDAAPQQSCVGTMDILASRGDRYAAWYIGSWYPVLLKQWEREIFPFIRFDADKYRPEFPEQLMVSKSFGTVGYAILRGSGQELCPFLVFKSGPKELVFGHNHFDQNSFALSYGGSWIVQTPGYQNFFNPAASKMTLGTLGQNSLVIDLDPQYLSSLNSSVPNHDQVKLDGGSITSFWTTPLLDIVQGDAARSYNDHDAKEDAGLLKTFRRTVTLVKPDYVLIRDNVQASKPHTYSFLFHFGTSARLRDEFGASVVREGTTDLLISSVSSSGQLLKSFGTFPGAEQYGTFLTVTTPPSLKTYESTLLYPQFVQSARDIGRFASLQLLGSSGHIIRISTSVWNDTFVFRDESANAAGRVDNAGVLTDARESYVRRTVKGDVQALAVMDGRILIDEQDTLLSSNTSMNAAFRFLPQGNGGHIESSISLKGTSGSLPRPPRFVEVYVLSDVRLGGVTINGRKVQWIRQGRHVRLSVPASELK